MLTAGGVRVTEEDAAAPPAWMERRTPDLADPATAGCLLALLPGSYQIEHDPGVVTIVVFTGGSHVTGRGETMGHACASALLAVWAAVPPVRDGVTS